MRQLKVNFSSGNLTLEGILTLPDTHSTVPGVVVCHPHPLYGGSMHNNVVDAVVTSLTEHRIAALKFNFRGTGQSQGTHDNGKGEQEDLVGALDFLNNREEIDSNRLGVVGYSFGGMVAAKLASRERRIRALALVSPALTEDELVGLKDLLQPVFVISGEQDGFINPVWIHSLKNYLPGTSMAETVASADHFWWGQERVMADKVAKFLLSHL